MGGKIIQMGISALSDPLLASSPFLHSVEPSDEDREVGFHEILFEIAVGSELPIDHRHLSHDLELHHGHGKKLSLA
jgi:hypothetical protein